MSLENGLDGLLGPDFLNLQLKEMDASKYTKKDFCVIMCHFYSDVTNPEKLNKTPLVQKLSDSIAGDPEKLDGDVEGNQKAITENNYVHWDSDMIWVLTNCKS